MSFFDVDFTKVSDEKSSIPEGKYLMKITDSSVVKNSKGNGYHLLVNLENAAQPSFKVFHRINLKNDNEVAQRIGLSQLAGLFSMLGYSKEQMNKLDNTVLANQFFEVLLKNRVYNDKTYLEISKFLNHVPKKEEKKFEVPF